MFMQGKYRTEKTKNRSKFYILLSVVFVVLMFKWGIPAIINFMANSGGPSTVNTKEKDIIPPQVPLLSALSEATNSAKLVVDGYTEAGAKVELFVNDISTSIDKAKDDGSFKLEGKLADGQNRIQVKAYDEANNESQSIVKLITLDIKPVELTIDAPKDGTEYFGNNNRVVDIKGSISKPGAEAVINGAYVVVDDNGKFLNRFQLADGANKIEIVATDKAGNTTTKELNLNFTP